MVAGCPYSFREAAATAEPAAWASRQTTSNPMRTITLDLAEAGLESPGR